MKLPKWLVASQQEAPAMPKSNIKVKDFVDSKTKRELVRVVGRPAGTPTIKKDEFLEYLSEARTTREIMTRFGYVNLSGAWKTVSRRMKEGSVVQLGHGLYISSKADVKEFNVAQLSERELQDRGYEALQRHLHYDEEDKEEVKPGVAIKPEVNHHATHLDGTKWMGRYQKVVDYLVLPHDIHEVAANSDYGAVSLGFVLKRLQNLGVIKKLPYEKRYGVRYISTGKSLSSVVSVVSEKVDKTSEKLPAPDPAMEVTEHGRAAYAGVAMQKPGGPVMVFDTPQALLDDQEAHANKRSSKNIEDLAMRYAWENDIEGLDKAALRKFIKWVSEQA